MKKVEFLYLSQKDVVAAGLTMKDAISIVEAVLTEHGLQKFENPPKPGIHTLEGTFIHAMPGFLPRKKAAGPQPFAGMSIVVTGTLAGDYQIEVHGYDASSAYHLDLAAPGVTTGALFEHAVAGAINGFPGIPRIRRARPWPFATSGNRVILRLN